MAKTLPAIVITDAQYARAAAAMPGATPAEKVAAYERMVKAMLTRVAIEAEIRAAQDAADAQVEAARQAALTNADNL